MNKMTRWGKRSVEYVTPKIAQIISPRPCPARAHSTANAGTPMQNERMSSALIFRRAIFCASAEDCWQSGFPCEMADFEHWSLFLQFFVVAT